MIGLRGEKPGARRGIAEEEAVHDRKAERTAEAEPEERPAPAAQRDEQPNAYDGEKHAETDARAARERERES